MKKQGFTLTELLVVVVVVGILASVVQPKFHKVVETYKALEAEHIMAAVRSEQTARCTLDKDYTKEPRKLVSMPAHDSRNFAYELTKTGMIANNLTKNYSLVMPSYQHGSICCQAQNVKADSYCSELIRNYQDCTIRIKDDTGCDAPDN